MYQIEKFSAPLAQKEMKLFESLVDVRDRHFLKKSDQGSQIWVAFFQGKPVGIVIAVNADFPFYSEIHSLFVLPEHRSQNLGSRLLLCVEDYLKEKACKYSTLFFRHDQDLAQSNEKFLARHGWNKSTCSTLLYLFHSSIFNAPWLQLYDKPLPSQFHEVSWKQVKERDRTLLQALEKENAFPYYVSPFRDEQFVEPLNSLALYKDEEVVGWMITHRILPHMIRYQAFFVEKKFQHTGIPMKILCDSIKLQIGSSVPYALVEINVSASEPDWLRFANKRLAPYAQARGFIRQSWKQFSA